MKYTLLIIILFYSSNIFAEDAQSILTETSVQGGVIVHLGCDDGSLTADLGRKKSYIVHGLTRDVQKMERARATIQKQGGYGRISIEQFSGSRLPYIDNMVNLLVAENLNGIALSEIMRVLAPRGVAYLKDTGTWVKTVKPVPDTIDDWTHYLYDASNNALSQDNIQPPLRKLQWQCGPRWTRNHNAMSSFSVMVSAGGRIFYILDEGPTSALSLPPKWSLIARDGFNGALLWKRPLPTWVSHYMGLKNGPTQITRRLVAVDEIVYVTLGFTAALSKIDAATGEILTTIEGTEGTEEVLVSDGKIFVTAKSTGIVEKISKKHPHFLYFGTWTKSSKPRRLIAIDDETDTILWESAYKIAPVTVATDAVHIYFYDGESIVAVNRETGKQAWRSAPVKGVSSIETGKTPTLVVQHGVVLFTALKEELTAVDATNGDILWTSSFVRDNFMAPADLIVADGCVWGADLKEFGTAKRKQVKKLSTGIFTGRDVRTGEIKSQFPPDIDNYWFHHRCHRSKATKNFFLTSRNGIEFVDYRKKTWELHNWVRGACLFGILPANGLMYAPPDPCSCYMESKMEGFSVLAGTSATPLSERSVPDDERLEKGPLYNTEIVTDVTATDWPTYRCNAARDGGTQADLSLSMKKVWKTDLGGELSSIIYAEKKVFVSSIEQHSVHALDGDSGKELWSYTAGARVDSPPSYYKGRLYFGSRDGWVYCLRAHDGALVWRFLAAEGHDKLISYNQTESAWPVHGSILIVNDTIYCVAGRSSFLEGGLQFYQLNPVTGELLSKNMSDDFLANEADKMKDIKQLTLPTANPDILSCDGTYIYMRSRRFDIADFLTKPKDRKDYYGKPHIFSSSGFLDSTWFHRTYWLANVKSRMLALGGSSGSARDKGKFAARIFSKGGSDIYGYGRGKRDFYRFGNKVAYHHLYAADLSQPKSDYRWSVQIPLFARGMLLTGANADNGILFVAGPPDLLGETELKLKNPISKKQPPKGELLANIEEQNASIAGEKGALLLGISTKNGETINKLKLSSPPVFDGMITGNGKLFISLKSGAVVCVQ